MVQRACHRTGEAESILKKLADRKDVDDLVWSDKAAQLLPGYDPAAWRRRLQEEADYLTLRAQTNSYRTYYLGLLQNSLGEKETAAVTLSKVFLFPDQRLAYHLTRIEQAASDLQPVR